MTLLCTSVLLASSFICSRRRREASNDRRRSPSRKRRRRWGWWRSIQHHHDGSRGGGEILNFMALKHCYGKWDESCVTFWRPPGALAFEASSVGMVIARHPIIRDQVFWSHRRGPLHCCFHASFPLKTSSREMAAPSLGSDLGRLQGFDINEICKYFSWKYLIVQLTNFDV